MNLKQLGWCEAFGEPFEKTYRDDGYKPARVIREDRGSYLICDGDGEYLGQLAGKFRHEAAPGEFPAVGDWVAAAVRANEGRATIHGVLPRRSTFSRDSAGGRTAEQVLAANVDTVFLVSGLDRDFNLRRIERYLTLAYNSGAAPVVVLNKADLCDDVDARVAEVETVAFGVGVHPVSAETGGGLDELRRYAAVGQTVALLGSSGVGKTTLINSLRGSADLQTGHVRAADGRGRHTTTHRELVVLDDGGVLIDTPGMRELQLWGDDAGSAEAFGDIAELAAACKFRDCSHAGEPGCAVQQAMVDGALDAGRYENYLQMQKELAYLAGRQAQQANQLERAKWKKTAELIKQVYRTRDKHR